MAKIFVVDDDPMLRGLILDMLIEDGGHSATGTGDALQCMEKLRGGAYQLAILDVSMPQINGLALLRLIRRDPVLKKLPVLMCTGRDMMGDIDQAFEAGANGYIVKPFTSASLNDSVSKAIAAAV